MNIDGYGYLIPSDTNNYNVHGLIKEVFGAANLPIYKEEIKLAKGIIHLRKILPSTHKNTSIMKILMAKSKVYTNDEYYGYGNTNILWHKTKIGTRTIVDTLVYLMLDPLYEDNDEEIFGDERDEYFCTDIKKCDNMKLMMLERQVDKLMSQYENNPSLSSVAFNAFFSKIGYLDIFKQEKYQKQFASEICKFIDQTYQYDNPTKFISASQGYEKSIRVITDTNKCIIFKHSTTKKSTTSIKFTFHTSMFVYHSNKNNFSHYKIEVEIFENQSMKVSFSLVKDKIARFDITHPVVFVKPDFNDSNVTFMGSFAGYCYTRDESIKLASFYNDVIGMFEYHFDNLKLPEYSEDTKTNVQNFKRISYFNVV
jgi:hypothetical protein